MERFITAVFESPDMADLARARLAERGIRVTSCSVEPTHRQDRPSDLGVVIDPYNPIFANNIGETWGPFAGASLGRVSGFAFVREPIAEDIPVPEEMLLSIRVDESDADRAEDILVGCHASSIRKA